MTQIGDEMTSFQSKFGHQVSPKSLFQMTSISSAICNRFTHPSRFHKQPWMKSHIESRKEASDMKAKSGTENRQVWCLPA